MNDAAETYKQREFEFLILGKYLAETYVNFRTNRDIIAIQQIHQQLRNILTEIEVRMGDEQFAQTCGADLGQQNLLTRHSALPFRHGTRHFFQSLQVFFVVREQ